MRKGNLSQGSPTFVDTGLLQTDKKLFTPNGGRMLPFHYHRYSLPAPTDRLNEQLPVMTSRANLNDLNRQRRFQTALAAEINFPGA